VTYITEIQNEIFSKAIEYLNLDKKNILKFKDQFVIGSISEITAVWYCVNLKRAKLDDKINQYLTPDCPTVVQGFTIHQLLTHTWNL
jgi:hypothetical protein